MTTNSARWSAVACVSALLWLPAVLSDALSPYTLRHILVAPPLRKLFGLTLVVGTCAVLLTTVVALLLRRLPLGRESDEVDAQLAFIPTVAFFAAALTVAPILHTIPAIATLPLRAALIVAGVTATIAAAILTHACRLGLTSLGARRPYQTTALLSLAAWFVAFVVRLSIGFGDPRIVVLLLVATAAAFMTTRAYRARFADRPHAYLLCASVGPILVTIVAPLMSVRTPQTEPREGTAHAASTNVLIVLIDTFRADSITPGGASASATPFLSELLAQPRSTFFADASAAASSTLPSVKALFTGQMPSAWGVGVANEPPSADALTLPKAFRRLGYATSLVSANPLIDCERFGAESDWCWSAGGYRYFLRSFLLNALWTANRVWDGFARVDRLHVHNIDGRVVLNLAQEWLRARSAHVPFFSYVHLIDPHWPYYTASTNNPPPARGEASYVPFLRLNQGSPENARLRTAPTLAALRERYARQIQHVDSLLRDFMREIDELGLRSNTLIIVVGDHGEEFLEHDGFGHGHDVFQEQVHVPLLILWPDSSAVSNPRHYVEEAVSLLDVVPTIEEILGARMWNGGPYASTSLGPLVRQLSREQLEIALPIRRGHAAGDLALRARVRSGERPRRVGARARR